jgi:signal transduction histidine kinase
MRRPPRPGPERSFLPEQGFCHTGVESLEGMERREGDPAGVRETPLVVVLPGDAPATPQALAHELQSPVKAIRLLAEAVRGSADSIQPEQLERCMQSILRGTEFMAEVIGRMTGRVPLRVRTTDLGRLVNETVDDMAALLEGRPVRLTLHTVDAVRVDPVAIREILVNLLSNAARYARPRTAISVNLWRSPAGVRLSVSDRCGGIPEDIRERIFEPFVRGHAGEMGLGLSLSRSIARAHGGDLSLERSRPGTCRFTLTIPVGPVVA